MPRQWPFSASAVGAEVLFVGAAVQPRLCVGAGVLGAAVVGAGVVTLVRSGQIGERYLTAPSKVIMPM